MTQVHCGIPPAPPTMIALASPEALRPDDGATLLEGTPPVDGVDPTTTLMPPPAFPASTGADSALFAAVCDTGRGAARMLLRAAGPPAPGDDGACEAAREGGGLSKPLSFIERVIGAPALMMSAFSWLA